MAGGFGDWELAERSKIYYIAGTWDPTLQATLAPEGSMYLRVGASGGAIYQKLDNGTTTNWVLNQTSGGGGGVIPVTQNIYVEPNGSDVTGDGSRSKPFQSINAAIAVCTNPALVYTIVPGSGDYSGADVTWLPNVCMIGSGAANINNNINYTSPAASESYFFFENVRMGGLITVDLSLAAIAIHTFTTGSYNINRIDTMGVGPWVLLVSDSTLGDCSFGGNNILSNALFVSSLEIKDGGTVLLGNSPVGIPVDLYGTATISFQASNTQYAVITGHDVDGNIPTIITDSAGLIGATYTDCNVFYGNSSGTLSIGSAIDGGLIEALGTGSSVVGSALSGGTLQAAGDSSFVLGNAQNTGVISTTTQGFAMGYTIGGVIRSAGLASFVFGANNSSNALAALEATQSGSLVFGVIVASAGAGKINSGGLGSLVFGVHTASSTGLIRSNVSSSLVFGQVNSSGTIQSIAAASLVFGNNDGTGFITNTSGIGSLTFGNIDAGSSGQIRSLGKGASASGSVGGTSIIEAKTQGSRAWGRALAGGQIVADVSEGTTAFGYVNGSGQVHSQGLGSLAFGRILGSGVISSSGSSSQSFGFIESAGNILSSGAGSLAFGHNQGSGDIVSSGPGSLAIGYNPGSGSIKAQGGGSFAFGMNQAPGASNIDAAASGAFAGGYIDAGATTLGIYAGGNGCIAFGTVGANGPTDLVRAQGVCSIALGRELDNSTNFSFITGQGHTTNNNYQFICGSYSNNTLNPRFAVGNGSFGSPSNCFEVAPSGAYKTYGTHTRAVEVVSSFPFTINTTVLNDIVIAVTAILGDKIFLPLSPLEGQCYTVVNDSTSAFVLDVDGNGNTINGALTDPIGAGSWANYVFGNGQWQKI